MNENKFQLPHTAKEPFTVAVQIVTTVRRQRLTSIMVAFVASLPSVFVGNSLDVFLLFKNHLLGSAVKSGGNPVLDYSPAGQSEPTRPQKCQY